MEPTVIQVATHSEACIEGADSMGVKLETAHFYCRMSCAIANKLVKEIQMENLQQTSTCIHRTGLHAALIAQCGKFVTVDFVKKSGERRTLNGRLGVRKHLRGGGNKVEALARPYLVVYDVKTQGYRTVNLATTSRVRADRQEFEVIG